MYFKSFNMQAASGGLHISTHRFVRAPSCQRSVRLLRGGEIVPGAINSLGFAWKIP